MPITKHQSASSFLHTRQAQLARGTACDQNPTLETGTTSLGCRLASACYQGFATVEQLRA